MSNIFDGDSDSDVEIKTNNEYAKSYNIWRKKEELNKLKTKYGDDVDFNENSSSSSSDDEEGNEWTEEVERDFFKTLACLKSKDPRIYNENVTFFQDKKEDNVNEKVKKRKDTPMFLKDYERKLILEKGGILSDEEDNESQSISATYAAEQLHIKESLKDALKTIDEDDGNDEWGGLFRERKKTREEKEKEEADYKKWLSGESEKIEGDVETELKPLKDFWDNPNLDQGEKFLRDYILKKKFLEKDNDNYIPTYDEIIHSDEDLSNDEVTLEKQDEFEHKYNFRFEEPDQEFIKRYPRTMDNSLRKTDDRRKVKRQEIKERKKKEKEEKMRDLKTLQELKRKEIEEKLEKLKEITGNSDIAFADEDIDGDFDPEAHDKRMQSLFNDDFYQGQEEQKPLFPEIDQELEIENWDRYQDENDDTQFVMHCEDENFNMDCDYDPKTSTQNELIEESKGKKKRKRKSKFAEALKKPKPKFDPNDKNYEKYFDEYYKLDCEDIIGDIPCRFKYRSVVPNDFGLSIEEILLAKEKELNKWCSLKKAVQIRPDHVEKYDQVAYKKKAQNINLKKRILPSLFVADSEDGEPLENTAKENSSENIEKTNLNNKQEIDISRNNRDTTVKGKNKKKGNKVIEDIVENNLKNIKTEIVSETSEQIDNISQIGKSNNCMNSTEKVEKKNKNKRSEFIKKGHDQNDLKNIKNENVLETSKTTEIDKSKNNSIDIIEKDKNNKNEEHDRNSFKNVKEEMMPQKIKNSNDFFESGRSDKNHITHKPKKSKKRRNNSINENDVESQRKKMKRNKKIKKNNQEIAISDARLAAYGINPKKFKNRIKYGHKN